MLYTQIPECLHKSLLEVIHQSNKSLENLVDECFNVISLNNNLLDPASCQTIISGQCSSPSSDKENSADCEEWAAVNTSALPSDLQHVPSIDDRPLCRGGSVEQCWSRDVIRSFIDWCAICDQNSSHRSWTVRSVMLEKHSVKTKIAPIFLPLSERKRVQQEHARDLNAKKRRQPGKSASSKKQKPQHEQLIQSVSGRNAMGTNNEQSSSAARNAELVVDKCSSTLSTDDRSTVSCPAKNLIPPSTHPTDGVHSSGNVDDDQNDLNCSSTVQSAEIKAPICAVSGDIMDKVKYDGNDGKVGATDDGDVSSDDSDNVTLIKLVKSTSKIDALKKKAEERRAKKREKRREKKAREKQVKQNKRFNGCKSLKVSLQKLDFQKVENDCSYNGHDNLDDDGPSKKSVSKSMRQMSLFDMSTKSRAQSDAKAVRQKREPVSPSKPRPIPACVRKLTQMLDTGAKPAACQYYLERCVKFVPRSQLERIEHLPTRTVILKKLDLIEEKRKLARMTVAQREEYIQMKKVNKQKQIIQKRKDLAMRFEDQLLTELKELPTASAVQLPDQLPATAFGDILMVTEFISCYSPFLLQSRGDSSSSMEVPFTARQLISALVADHSTAEFSTLLDIMILLIRALLNDAQYSSLSELGCGLSELSANTQSAPDLFRLLILHSSLSENGKHGDQILICSHKNVDHAMSSEGSLLSRIVRQLESSELSSLCAESRLYVLCALVDRLLFCESLSDYQEHLEDQHRQLFSKKNTILRQRRDAGETQTASVDNAVPDEAEDVDGESEVHNDADSENRRSKRSRRSVEEARRVREHLDEINKQKRFAEQERAKQQKVEDGVLSDYRAVSCKQAASVRRQPLGVDRHHRRYWLLPSVGEAGIYVETGWAGTDTVPSSNLQSAATHDDDDDDEPLACVSTKLSEDQSSYPEVGANEWFCYGSLAEIDRLISCLAVCGKRESVLKNSLQSIRTELQSQFSSEISSEKEPNSRVSAAPINDDGKTDSRPHHPTNTETPTSADVKGETTEKLSGNSDKQLCATSDVHIGAGVDTVQMVSLKERILSLERELASGYLGGVPECGGRSKWLQQVETAEHVSDLLSAVLSCHQYVARRALKPAFISATDKKLPVICDSQRSSPNAGICGNTSSVLNTEAMWRNAVQSCRTLSRLHMLVDVLDSSIRWELSSAEKKCRVCRRAGEQSEATVCPRCNFLYHWQCVRPALYQPPAADWCCPSCTPRDQRPSRAATVTINNSLQECVETVSGEQKNAQCEDEHEHRESVCRVCQTADCDSDQLFQCPQCPAVFHKNCHQPPVLLRIRAGWQCMDCKETVTRSTRGARSAKKRLPSEILRCAASIATDDSDDGATGRRSSRARVAVSRERRSNRRSAVVSDDEEFSCAAGIDRSADSRVVRRHSTRVSRSRRPLIEQDSDDDEDADAEEARIRDMVTDDDDDDDFDDGDTRVSGGRRVCWQPSSPARRQQIRRVRSRQLRDTSSDTPSLSSSLHAKISPNKVELAQQPDAVCLYCECTRTLKHELIVCASCPQLYHRKCARRAGLVDDWQCSKCLLPDEKSRNRRNVRPRFDQDFEYDE